MNKGFNTVWYSHKNGPENKPHRQAKIRIYELASQAGYKAGGTPDNEVHFPEWNKESLSIFSWPMDVTLTKGFGFDMEVLDVEIDGLDHERTTRQRRDKHRDEVASSYGIKVIRFMKDDIVGKTAQTDQWILDRLE